MTPARQTASLILLLLIPSWVATAQNQRAGETPGPKDGKGLYGSLAVSSGFGVAVAISDSVAFVGESRGSGETGNVTLLVRSNIGSWYDAATLVAPGEEPENRFGETLDTDGNRVIVGAPQAHGGEGRAYIFVKQSPEIWAYEATLESSSPDSSADFGKTAVSISGEIAIVGESFANGMPHGAAHVYRYDGGNWVPDTTLPFIETGDRFGWGTAVSGERAAVAAFRWNGEKGKVYVYDRTAQTWPLSEELTMANPTKGERLGYDLDLDGDRVVAGNATVDDALRAGYRIFDYDDGSGIWSIADSVVGHGWRVDLDSASVVSGFFEYDYALVASGGSQAGSWTPEDSLFGTGILSGDKFGYDVGISGDHVIVGAPGDFIGVGKAFIFERNPDSTWSEVAVFAGTGSPYTSVFGPVACSGGTADIFECKDVDLRSFLTTTDLGASSMSDVWGWTDPVTDHEYALAAHRSGTAFVDVTDPDDPVLVGTLPLHAGSNASNWRDVKTYGDYAFIVADGAGSAGMQVFDLTELRDAQGLPSASAKATSPMDLPVTFAETAHYDGVASSHNVAVNDSSATAFVVGSDQCGGGIHMVDVSSPESPSATGCYADETTGRSGTGYTHDIQCVKYHGPDATYVGHEICFAANETAVLIADVTNNASPSTIGKGEYPNSRYVHQGWLTDDHRFFFQDDELDEAYGEVSSTRTLIWDVTDLEDPVLVAEYASALPAIDHNQYVRGDYVYQAQYAAGLRILDITGVNNSTASKTSIITPTEVAFFDTSPGGNGTNFDGAWSVYPFFKSGNVLVTSRAEGLFVLTPTVVSIEADLKVFLEGPYAGSDAMSVSALFEGATPTGNPYKSADFSGTPLELGSLDSVVAIPAGTIDWIQVELRTDTDADSAVARRTAILLEDGSVVEATGSALTFPGVDPDQYYVVVRHRNHLSAMSSVPVDFTSGTGVWDFTTGSGQAFGSDPMRSLGDGNWGLFAGEAVIDGVNNAGDFNEWLSDTKAAATGYLLTDFTLDGQVTASDFNMWLANTKTAAASQVPE